jgi:hypothetical protein
MPNGTGAAPVPKLHLAPQRSDVLLGPVVTALGTLEWRTERYLERLKLSDQDAQAIRSANDALKQALTDIETVRNDASSGKSA